MKIRTYKKIFLIANWLQRKCKNVSMKWCKYSKDIYFSFDIHCPPVHVEQICVLSDFCRLYPLFQTEKTSILHEVDKRWSLVSILPKYSKCVFRSKDIGSQISVPVCLKPKSLADYHSLENLRFTCSKVSEELGRTLFPCEF